VVTAAVSIVFIIALVAYLCVKTKSYKYKRKLCLKSLCDLQSKVRVSSKIIIFPIFHPDESERSLAETASIEEGVLYGSSVELRQSQKKIGTLKRKSLAGANKPPPRPTPGSVTYTDDESDKAYDHNPDESSLTEKPSEISSTDSQVRLKKDMLSLLNIFKIGGGGSRLVRNIINHSSPSANHDAKYIEETPPVTAAPSNSAADVIAGTVNDINDHPSIPPITKKYFLESKVIPSVETNSIQNINGTSICSSDDANIKDTSNKENHQRVMSSSKNPMKKYNPCWAKNNRISPALSTVSTVNDVA
jgi:hypothetical protein